MRPSIVFAIAILFASFAPCPGQADELPQYRWVCAQTNLQVTENADRLEQVLRRAKAAGYNGVLLADYKFNVLDRVVDRYFVNARRIRELCDQLQMELVPSIGAFGYSSGILAHDPNLAEGLPVREMPMVVRGGRVVLANAAANLVPVLGPRKRRGDCVPSSGRDAMDCWDCVISANLSGRV